MKVLAHIQNNSSREIKPKYCVYRKHSFFAQGRRRVHTKDLIKEVGEPIPASANVKVSKVINIPHDMEPSNLECGIIKVEHRLRVRLFDQETENSKTNKIKRQSFGFNFKTRDKKTVLRKLNSTCHVATLSYFS